MGKYKSSQVKKPHLPILNQSFLGIGSQTATDGVLRSTLNEGIKSSGKESNKSNTDANNKQHWQCAARAILRLMVWPKNRQIIKICSATKTSDILLAQAKST